MSTEVAARGKDALRAAATDGRNLKPLDAIKLKVEGIQKQLAASIPATMQKYLTPERLTRLFWQEARRNPKLLECVPETVASGLMTAAQLGIEIGMQGQGWLVPYYNKKNKRLEAQFIIGYKGMIGLARRSGEVLSIETHIVFEKDKFNLKLGINTTVEHEPYLEGDRGRPRLTYGVARFRDGGYHFEWMGEVEIMSIKARSQAKDFGPWVTDTDQMRRKTVIRRMSNYLPMSIEFANALSIDDATNAGNKAVIAGQFVEIEEGSDLVGVTGDGDAGSSGETDAGADAVTDTSAADPAATEPSLDDVKKLCASALAATDPETRDNFMIDATDTARKLSGDAKALAENHIAETKVVLKKAGK